MQNRLFSAFRFAFPAYFLLGAASASADVGLQKLALRESVPVGMEMQFAGTSLEAVRGVLNADALTRDHSSEAHLAAGASQMVFKFSRQAVLRNLSFVNDGMQGEVRLLASHDGQQWTPLASERFMTADRQVSVSPGCAQGRYLKLEFDSRQGGTIRCLRIQGDDSDLDYRVVQDDAGKLVNFASGLGGGRMVYATPAGTGKELMVVYDLGQPRQLTEFASVHSRQPVALKVFALPAMPEKEDWRGRLQADPAQVGQQAHLVAEAADTFGSGHVRIQLEKSVTTRFVALSWQGSEGLAGFKSYEIAARGPGFVLHSGRTAELAAATDVASKPAPADRSVAAVEAPTTGPVIPASFQPQSFGGSAVASVGSFSAGSVLPQGKSNVTGARRISKADGEPPPEDEEFAGPATGIDWCFTPSAP